MKSLIGIVVTKKTAKTALVAVLKKKMYSKYNVEKSILKKYMVHDDTNLSQIGSIVIIVPCSPKSKKKRWTINKFI